MQPDCMDRPGFLRRALAAIYLNTTPYPFRDPKGEIRVLYQVRPTRIQTFGQP